MSTKAHHIPSADTTAASSPAPFLALENITFSWPGRDPLFRNMHLVLEKGRKLGLYGHNGQGKTTLFRLLTGLERPQQGRILLLGSEVRTEKDFRLLRRKVGYVLQNADDQLFSPTVLDDVAFGPLNLGHSPDEAREEALATLASLGLAGLESRLCHQLSGGEKKLVSLAGVLVMQPELILLDEPTNSLDPRARERLREILASLEVGRIVISHARDFLEAVTDECMTIEHGTLVRHADWTDFFA